jgi:hypothetical protein
MNKEQETKLLDFVEEYVGLCWLGVGEEMYKARQEIIQYVNSLMAPSKSCSCFGE